MSRLPPVPSENRSHAGPEQHAKASAADPHRPHDEVNPDKRGHQANSKINTTHQGYQQDR